MGEGDNRVKKGKGCQGMPIKDPGTKPRASRIKGGRWVGVGQGKVVGKWRELYLNNNKTRRGKNVKNF